ncbi:hypothetical protein [Halomonas sp. GD1P12]|uniref:hypothetical protein n=1 Tax=Halomonas sp. GD1P12 TaxID=2982691 RepID=UPI0021E3C367|nr:hypothetical protein [Halomonas sp. GD1P12]UYF98956.1 hypothetical protein OCT39_12040 [Halomonas sp. GD1P12]
MDTRESKTPKQEKEHVMGQRQPERAPQMPAHRQPEARRSPKGFYKLLPIVVSVLAVALALFIIAGILVGK